MTGSTRRASAISGSVDRRIASGAPSSSARRAVRVRQARGPDRRSSHVGRGPVLERRFDERVVGSQSRAGAFEPRRQDRFFHRRIDRGVGQNRQPQRFEP